jgi:hypothetical protein
MTEAHKHLWYRRRDGEVRGPYPAKQITQHILLGRIRDTDELSQDQETWKPYAELPALMPEAMRAAHASGDHERLRNARRHADERRSDRRRKRGATPAEQRRKERRRPEPVEDIAFRATRNRWDAQYRIAAARRYRWPLLFVTVFIVLFVAAQLYQRYVGGAASTRDCNAKPAPQVNWSHCHFEGATLTRAPLTGATLNTTHFVGAALDGARLEGSDLRYADLSGANLKEANLSGALLTGAMLRSAILTGADLSDADLSYTNLLGAELTGATLTRTRLGRAIWTDGRVCAPDSVDTCQ